MRILIVKLSAVGDVVHALPALSALRAAMPGAHIGWVVNRGIANLIETHPDLNAVIPIKKRPWGVGELRRQLRAPGPWDVAIDFQGLTKSGAVTWLSGATQRIGFAGKASREFNRFFMTERIQPAATTVIGMNLDLLRPLGITPGPARALIPIIDADRESIARWSREAGCTGEKFAVMDLFAGWQTKLWPEECWIETARQLSAARALRPLLVHGPGERHHAEQVAAKMKAGGVDAVVAPDTTLRESAALVAGHAAVYIGADTGPMHIAAAVGAPTVALFGPSDPARNAPAFDGARYRTLQCVAEPCANTFTRDCGHHPPGRCMANITPEQVVAAVGALLG